MSVSAAPRNLLRFDSDEVEPGLRYDAWQQQTIFRAKMKNGTTDRFRAWTERASVGDVFFQRAFTSSPHLGRFQPPNRGGKLDAVYIGIFEQGDTQWLMGEKPSFKRGDVVFADLNLEYAYYTSNSFLSSVFIPYEVAGFDPTKHNGQQKFALGSTENRLIQSLLRTAFDEVSRGDVENHQTLQDAVIGILRALVLREKPDESALPVIRKYRGAALRSYIAENLHQHGLSPDHLCQQFACSEATLRREFAQDGGVINHIRQQRLERALADLVSKAPERGGVSEVAERWGFNDPAYFSRVFRRYFGFPPSDAIAIAE